MQKQKTIEILLVIFGWLTCLWKVEGRVYLVYIVLAAEK